MCKKKKKEREREREREKGGRKGTSGVCPPAGVIKHGLKIDGISRIIALPPLTR